MKLRERLSIEPVDDEMFITVRKIQFSYVYAPVNFFEKKEFDYSKKKLDCLEEILSHYDCFKTHW